MVHLDPTGRSPPIWPNQLPAALFQGISPGLCFPAPSLPYAFRSKCEAWFYMWLEDLLGHPLQNHIQRRGSQQKKESESRPVCCMMVCPGANLAGCTSLQQCSSPTSSSSCLWPQMPGSSAMSEVQLEPWAGRGHVGGTKQGAGEKVRTHLLLLLSGKPQAAFCPTPVWGARLNSSSSKWAPASCPLHGLPPPAWRL